MQYAHRPGGRLHVSGAVFGAAGQRLVGRRSDQAGRPELHPGAGRGGGAARQEEERRPATVRGRPQFALGGSVQLYVQLGGDRRGGATPLGDGFGVGLGMLYAL